MATQTFEIIDGVYRGPRVWEGDLNLRPSRDTLISLGSLNEVRGWLDIEDSTSLATLGSLKKVGGYLSLTGCTNLTSLGSLKELTGSLWLADCAGLLSLGSLNKVGNWLDIRGCTRLTSLGSLKKVGRHVYFDGIPFTLQEAQEKICYYSSLPLHEALNALHTNEVHDVPLYKNILLQVLQGD